MFPVSAEFLRAVRHPQRVVTAVEWRRGLDDAWKSLEWSDGTVINSRISNTRWQCNLTLPPGSIEVTPNGFSSYGTQLRIFRGIRIPRIGVQSVPWGVYRIDTANDQKDKGIQVAGFSREIQLIDGRFPAPRRIGGDTAVTVVEQLVSEVCPDVSFSWRVDGSDNTVASFIEEKDRWGTLDGGIQGTAIATWLNGEMYFDGRGVFVVRNKPSIDNPVDWAMQTNDLNELGVMISPAKTFSRDGVYNLVVGMMMPSDGTKPIGPAYAWDTNPGSPTYAGPDPIGDPQGAAEVAPFGVIPVFYTTPLAATLGQLQKIVSGLLQDTLGLATNLAFSVSSNPALEAGDVVQVGDDRYIIDQWTSRLAGATMDCITRVNKTTTGDIQIAGPTDG